MKNKHSQAIDGEAKAKPEVIKLGLNLHVRQVTGCRQLDGSTPKPVQQWGPWKLLDQIKDWVKGKVYSCYEAGICGHWYHRELIKAGAVNFVVVPPSAGEPTHQAPNDRSARCQGITGSIGDLSQRQSSCEEHRGGTQP